MSILLGTLAPIVLCFSAPASPAASLGANLIRAGLGPDALAAAGVQAQAVPSIVDDAGVAVDQGGLAAADAAYAEAKMAVDTLLPIVQSGQATDQQVADLGAAQGSLAAAESAQEAALAQVFAAGTEELSSDQVAVLSTMRAQARWRLPQHFLVVERTEEEWIALRDALAAEKSCARIGDTLDAGVAADLAAWRAQEPVALANTYLDANGPSVKAAWESACTE